MVEVESDALSMRSLQLTIHQHVAIVIVFQHASLHAPFLSIKELCRANGISYLAYRQWKCRDCAFLSASKTWKFSELLDYIKSLPFELYLPSPCNCRNERNPYPVVIVSAGYVRRNLSLWYVYRTLKAQVDSKTFETVDPRRKESRLIKNADIALTEKEKQFEKEFPNMNELRTMQEIFPNSPGDQIFEQLAEFIRVTFPHHCLRELLLLRSKPGLVDQAVHTDFDVSNSYPPFCDQCWSCNHPAVDSWDSDFLSRIANDLFCSWSMILALENDTEVVFYYSDEQATAYLGIQRVILKAGQFVIWRGNMFHGGAGAKKSNSRMFAVLESASMPLSPNEFFWSYLLNHQRERDLILSCSFSQSH